MFFLDEVLSLLSVSTKERILFSRSVRGGTLFALEEDCSSKPYRNDSTKLCKLNKSD
jgi:hypothetical protein